MNPLETLGSFFSYLGKKIPQVKRPLRGLSGALFPEFLRIPIPNIILRIKLSIKNILLSYFFILFFVFVVQAGWALINNRLFPDSDPNTKNFLEDWPNLLNYLVIVEGYVISGIYFLVNIYNFESDFLHNSITSSSLSPLRVKILSGYFGFGLSDIKEVIPAIGKLVKAIEELKPLLLKTP